MEYEKALKNYHNSPAYLAYIAAKNKGKAGKNKKLSKTVNHLFKFKQNNYFSYLADFCTSFFLPFTSPHFSTCIHLACYSFNILCIYCTLCIMLGRDVNFPKGQFINIYKCAYFK